MQLPVIQRERFGIDGEMQDMKQSFVKYDKGTVYYWHTDIDSTKETLFLLHMDDSPVV